MCRTTPQEGLLQLWPELWVALPNFAVDQSNSELPQFEVLTDLVEELVTAASCSHAAANAKDEGQNKEQEPPSKHATMHVRALFTSSMCT
eukprot:5686447-Amphidinium_carterae.1